MKADIRGKWAVVTGADGGIGEAFCRELAGRGANLLMVSDRGRNLESLRERLAHDFKTELRTLTLDLTLPDAARRLMSCLDEFWIEPYICINNAGIFNFSNLTDLSESRRSLYIDLHVRAVTEISVRMAEQIARKGEGYILNMSSMSCWMPMPGIALYSATKAYIRVFSRALRCEMKDAGVSVTAACPGGIATDLFGLPDNLKRLAVRIGAITTPRKFARKAVGRMLRGKAQYINGGLNRIAILAVGITPERLRMAVKHLMLDKGIRR